MATKNQQQERLCGQCAEPTDRDEYSCPMGKCNLVLCPMCSNPETHIRENGSCTEWWGKRKEASMIQKSTRLPIKYRWYDEPQLCLECGKSEIDPSITAEAMEAASVPYGYIKCPKHFSNDHEPHCGCGNCKKS